VLSGRAQVAAAQGHGGENGLRSGAVQVTPQGAGYAEAGLGLGDGIIEPTRGRFFRPPYVGGRLDRDVAWPEIAELCQDAYRVIALARLVALLDG
jgi:hypothetical protein